MAAPGAKMAERLAARGVDPARLPPGQYPTAKWPVLHAGSVPRVDPASFRLALSGLVAEPGSWSLAELKELPSVEVTCDIHCVTRWSRFDMTWRGVSFGTLAGRVRPLPEAAFAVAHAIGGYTANLPLPALADDDVLIAYEADGAELAPEHGYPLRLVVPKRYFWKSAKWLTGIELVAADRPGYWERLGYHNDALPFLEQRYAF